MTYQECEEVINLHLPNFRVDPFFEMSGKPARFLAFIIAPKEADLSVKQYIYQEGINKARDNKSILLDLGIWDKEKTVYIIYQQAGREIVIPFESYLSAINNAS
jgi:hypothetical protein